MFICGMFERVVELLRYFRYFGCIIFYFVIILKLFINVFRIFKVWIFEMN